MTGGASAFLVAGEDDAAIAALGAALVVDATGEPDALATALAAAGEGARVVLLGSPRGVTRDFPSGELRRKGLTLVGAHISTIVRRGRERGVDLIRTEGEAFLAALANGLRVADLAGGPVDPREADAFYRSLANSQSLGAFFDWTALPQDQRLRRRRIWARPATDARGAAYAGEPLPVPEPLQAHVAAQLADPFLDAAGRIRFALLGCGDIGVANAAAIAAAPNTELVACYDPDAELARDVAGRFGAQVAESVEALFERKDVDAAFLAVPHHLHLPLARLAAEAGLHVVVEKPLAHDLASAVAIVEATQRAGVALTVCFPFRYEPAVVAARYLFEAGAVGEFAGAVVSYHLDKPASYWRSGYSNRSVSDWRQSRALAGGGILIMNLTHHIDLARHIGRVEVDSVTATEEPGGDTVEDGIAVAVKYANGSLGTVAGQAASRGGLPGEFHVRGREGHVALEPAPRVHASHAVAGLSPGRWHALPTTPQPDVRAVFVSRFASALARGERPDVTADDALAVQAFVEAAYESSRRGEAVRPADLLARALA
jgi:predicted dehydrogenase